MSSDGWQRTTLGDVVWRFVGGGTPARDRAEFWDGDIPWATVKDLKERHLEETTERISEAGLRDAGGRLADPGSILLATRMAVGRVARAGRTMAFNQDIKLVVPGPLILDDFLFYWLEHMQARIEGGASGSTVKGVRLETLGALPLLLPSLETQRRIIRILDGLEGTIEASDRVIRQTRRVREGLADAMLSRGGGRRSGLRTSRVKLPSGWSIRPLQEVCERIGVGIASAATHAYQPRGIPLIRNQDIRPGRIDTSSMLYISPTLAAGYREKQLRAGDVLTIRTGYPGTSAVVPPELDGAHSFTTLVVRPDPSRLLSDFFTLWMNSAPGRRYVNAGQAGGAQKNLNAGTLQRMLIAIPPLEEQRRIVETIVAFQKTESCQEKELEQLRRSKQALMQRLFAGAN